MTNSEIEKTSHIGDFVKYNNKKDSGIILYFKVEFNTLFLLILNFEKPITIKIGKNWYMKDAKIFGSANIEKTLLL